MSEKVEIEKIDIEELISKREEIKLDKEKDFALWYRLILRLADIVDDRYPVKGFYYLPWYGFTLVKNVISILENLLRNTGHIEEKYPALIPQSLFIKLKEFFEGFQGEGYVVSSTIQGKELEEKLILRPTSEAVMYYFFSLRIKSYKDLPLKVFQTVNVFRSETKMTKPFLRLREVMFFNEAHTAHATLEDAEKQFKEALEIYKKFYDELGIPYLIIKTPEWDTFPGALYNYDFLTVMPDGKGLELGSVINLGQKFSKAYDIKFLDKDGQWKYVWQLCYGISERSVGALLALYGDNLGLIIPPKFAPVQIVIIPIYKEETKEEVLNYAKEVYNLLKDKFRVYLDDRDDKTPGWKFYYWDIKGVPLRIDIGLEEVKNRIVTLVKRDNKEKIKVSLDKIYTEINNLFNLIEENMRKRVFEWFKSKIKIVESLEEFEKYVKETLVIIPMCESKEESDYIQEKYNRDVLGFLVDGKIIKNENSKCIFCGKETNHWAVIGKTY